MFWETKIQNKHNSFQNCFQNEDGFVVVHQHQAIIMSWVRKQTKKALSLYFILSLYRFYF
jgi:hypothetical protein